MHAGKFVRCIIIEFPSDYDHDMSQMTTHTHTHAHSELEHNTVVIAKQHTHRLTEKNEQVNQTSNRQMNLGEIKRTRE